MTRINLIPVKELSDQHLLAEMRELPRIFSHVEKHGVSENIPDKFTLGKGHIKFFTNKLYFLRTRYYFLVREWKARGFNWSYDVDWFYSQINHLMDNGQVDLWYPTEEEIAISRERIEEKIKMKPDFYRWTKTEGGK